MRISKMETAAHQQQPLLRSTKQSNGRSMHTNNKLTCAKIILLLAVVSASWQPHLARSAPSDRSNSINNNYYGSYIGRLERRAHNVSGEVYVVDEQSLFIKGFNYDGLASDAYFWSSTTSQQPSSQDGFIVPDEKGSTKPLERYVNKDIVLRLPEGKTLREINWLSIWSRQTKQNLGEILIGKTFNIPRPLEIEPLSQLAHGVKSGPITIIDAQTLLVPDFHYDGLGPAGFFWLTRGSQGLSANGLRLKDENGSASPLRKYSGESVVIVLPDELTIYDFDYFGVWCKEFQVNFGQTRIPQGSKVPPSPKMLGIKPENKLNCEILYDDLGFEIRWVLDGDDIVMQLVGKIEPGEYMAFGLGKDDSKSDMNNADAVVAWVNRSSGQVHAVDYFLGGKQQCVNIVDPSKATAATCSDTKLPGGGDSLTLLHGAIVNGYSMVTFKRPQLGVDELYDQHVYSDGQQSVVWAIGSLNERNEPAYHRLRTRTNMFIDFARNPHWNCPIPDHNASMHNNLPMPAASQVDPQVVLSQQQQQQRQQQPPTTTMLPTTTGTDLISTNDLVSSARQSPIASSKPTQSQQPSTSRQQQADSSSSEHSGHAAGNGGQPIRNKSVDHNDPWFIPSIICPSDRTFYAQIGPTGGHKGYEGLTGRTSWGVSWYVNGLMIPELVIERGQMYRFVVEGGNVKTSPARRHPLYLTDSVEGGFDFKTDDERMKERIFAGVAIRGDEQYVPTAEGRLCEWKQTNATLANPDLYQTFSAYQRTLKLECLPGQASMLKFSPDSSTPDTIYYQCYTHRFMGWRIKVVNSCSAYLNALQQSRAGASPSSSSGGGNNFKREVKNPRSLEPARQAASKQEGAVINRRQLMEVNAVDSMKGSQSEPRITFEASNHHTFLAPPDEFSPDELLAANNLQTIDGGGGGGGGGSNSLDMMPNDMLILNNSQLIQRNLLNLSTIDEILKLSPSDLELIDNNQLDNSLKPYIQAAALAGGSFNTIPLPLHSFTANNLNLQGNNNNKHNLHNTQKANKTAASNNKSTAQITQPKTLHSYLRRLASIYYPVQQQLVSILANNQQNGTQTVKIATLGAPTNNNSQASSSSSSLQSNQQQGNNNAAASSDQVSSFSLSNLVPKSKIDLSKSSISKKLNKLRFKTGRKYEPQHGHLAKPPTPANEFNYDIFNNQLAQLEKQQHQLQSLESLAAADWPQSADASSPYLSMLTSATSNTEDQQQFENLFASPQQQQQTVLSNLLGQPNISPFFQQQMSRFLPHQQQPSFRPHPIRLSDIQNGALQTSQTPSLSNGLDYLTMALNRSNEYVQAPPLLPLISDSQHHYLQQQQLSRHYEPSWMSQLNADLSPQPNRQYHFQQQHSPHAHHQHNHHQQHQQQQPSVYVTRLPQQSLDSSYQQQQQMDTQAADRTPNWLTINSNGNVNQQVPPSHSVRYPDIQPYNGNQQTPTTTNQMSSILSVSHEANQQQQSGNAQTGGGDAAVASIYPQSAAPTPSRNGGQSADSESLSGSGSGSHYDFTQQPPIEQHHQQPSMSRGQQQQQQQSGGDDHMIAMERFSKQSSERRAPSIVHPVTGEQVHNVSDQQQLESSASSSNAPAPRRFSSVLIDKHIVAPNGPAATTVQPNELLDVDQTVQHVLGLPMQSINVSQAHSSTNSSSAKLQRTGVFTNAFSQHHQPADGCSNGCQQQQQSTTTMSSIVPSSPSPSPPPMSIQSSGPLTPSFGPPQMNTRFTVEGETSPGQAPPVYKSTLIEPIVSTLVHQPSSSPPMPAQGQTRPFISNVNFDSSPFTPIEVTSSTPSLYEDADQFQLAASNLLASHLRPPLPSIESMMIGQQQQHHGLHQFESLRSEPPPVQVASFLAQHLASHQSQATGAGSGGNSFKQQSNSISPTSIASTANSKQASAAVPASELIILKPSKQQSTAQVYALKPEYMTNQFKPPVIDNSLITSFSVASATNTGEDTDFYYSNKIGAPGEAGSASTTKRLAAGHQFDRLSSLSSPPSTSIALDPMQAANSMNSYIKQQNQQNTTSLLDGTSKQQQRQNSNHQNSFKKETGHSGNSTTTSVTPNQILPSVTIEAINDDNNKLARHRHNYIASSKPIALNFEMQNVVGGSSGSADGVRLNPAGPMSSGGNINIGNTLNRDNNTDNAILSHVMSLISSNEVPTPPLIPGSSYSNSDYFLPISDRTPRSIRG